MAEPVIAVVGAESLLGREVRDLLGTGNLGADLRLVSETVPEAAATTKLTTLGDEPSFIASLSASALEGASALVLAGSPETARLVTGLKLEIPIVDIAGALEDQPNARLRAPLLEPHDFRVAPDAIQVIAHPAAIAIALVLTRIHQVFPFRKSLVHIFEPASERGTAGIEELQQQTVNLLSFKPLPKKVYDTQIAYTLLPAFGEEAPLSLSDIEARIERHLATLLSLSGNVPIPSLRLIQAPLFHGYSFSLWIEFETNPGVAALQQVLNEPPIEVRDATLEPPTNVAVAGQSASCRRKRFRRSARSNMKQLAPFLAVLMLSGCGYQVGGTGDALPKTIHTIAIPPVKNVSITYKLTDLLNTYISREFISRTRYRIVPDPNEADAILTAAVVNYVTYPTIYDANSGRATGTQVIVTVTFTLRDKSGAVIMNRPNFEVRERYEISIDPKQYFDESEPALQRLAGDVSRTIVSAILNKF